MPVASLYTEGRRFLSYPGGASVPVGGTPRSEYVGGTSEVIGALLLCRPGLEKRQACLADDKAFRESVNSRYLVPADGSTESLVRYGCEVKRREELKLGVGASLRLIIVGVEVGVGAGISLDKDQAPVKYSDWFPYLSGLRACAASY